MRLTASQALPQLPVQKDQLEWEYNKSTKPLLEQLRTGANAIGRERPAAVTSDGAGTYVRVWESPELLQDCSWMLVARVAGVGGAERATYWIVETFTSVAGVVAAGGAPTTIHSFETAAAIDARFGVDAVARVAYVEARDDAATAMYWTAVVDTFEGPAAP